MVTGSGDDQEDLAACALGPSALAKQPIEPRILLQALIIRMQPGRYARLHGSPIAVGRASCTRPPLCTHMVIRSGNVRHLRNLQTL